MRISTRGRYALRVLYVLAQKERENPQEVPLVSAKEVAEMEGISEKYLEQIFSSLVKASLVVSVRGAQGGYRLSRPASDITVGEALRVTEGSLSTAPCLEDEAEACGQNGSCETVQIFIKINEAISNVVDHMTIDSLLPKEA